MTKLSVRLSVCLSVRRVPIYPTTRVICAYISVDSAIKSSVPSLHIFAVYYNGYY